MFYSLNRYSQYRWPWVLFLLCCIGFELTALYFQEVLNLLPCPLCIKQRWVFLGLIASCLFCLINPKILLFRLIAIFAWLYLAYLGFDLAVEQASIENRNISMIIPTCSSDIYPNWLPLDNLFPMLFKVQTSCGLSQWRFLAIEMSQWMVIIFSVIFLVGCFVLIAQFFSKRTTKLSL